MQDPMNIVIVGAGPAGLSAAIALTHFLKPTPRITILEVRAAPSTQGGAINLTPNALRCLHHLDILPIIKARGYGADIRKIHLFSNITGQGTGEVDFAGPTDTGYGSPPFKALRILRANLQSAMLEAVGRYDNISIKWDAQIMGVSEHKAAVQINLRAQDEDLHADMLLGCDGIHSCVRKLVIEPGRNPTYSGIVAAAGLCTLDEKERQKLTLVDTALYSARRGSLFASYHDRARDSAYVGALMETAEAASRSGWKARGADAESVRQDIIDRFVPSALSGIDDLIRNAKDWFLWPIYTLPGGGKWAAEKGRILLLGDAAHAMPPQGESTGIAIEDTIILARVLAHYSNNEDRQDDSKSSEPIAAATLEYDRLRRPRIDAAFAQAHQRWETVKDSGWFAHKLKCWLIPWVLWWTIPTRAKIYEEDVYTDDLGIAVR